MKIQLWWRWTADFYICREIPVKCRCFLLIFFKCITRQLVPNWQEWNKIRTFQSWPMTFEMQQVFRVMYDWHRQCLPILWEISNNKDLTSTSPLALSSCTVSWDSLVSVLMSVDLSCFSVSCNLRICSSNSSILSFKSSTWFCNSVSEASNLLHCK